MEFFLPSVFILIFGAIISFMLIPKFSPTVVLILAALLLGFAVYHHIDQFKAEYKLSTWQIGLARYAPFLALGFMILFILFYIFTKFRGGEVPIPDIAASLPSPADAITSFTETVSNVASTATNAVANAASTVNRNVTKAANTVVNTVSNANKNKGSVTKSFFNVV
jgi:hypothetical protein